MARNCVHGFGVCISQQEFSGGELLAVSECVGMCNEQTSRLKFDMRPEFLFLVWYNIEALGAKPRVHKASSEGMPVCLFYLADNPRLVIIILTIRRRLAFFSRCAYLEASSRARYLQWSADLNGASIRLSRAQCDHELFDKKRIHQATVEISHLEQYGTCRDMRRFVKRMRTCARWPSTWKSTLENAKTALPC